jgi:hypothetical protein
MELIEEFTISDEFAPNPVLTTLQCVGMSHRCLYMANDLWIIDFAKKTADRLENIALGAFTTNLNYDIMRRPMHQGGFILMAPGKNLVNDAVSILDTYIVKFNMFSNEIVNYQNPPEVGGSTKKYYSDIYIPKWHGESQYFGASVNDFGAGLVYFYDMTFERTTSVGTSESPSPIISSEFLLNRDQDTYDFRIVRMLETDNEKPTLVIVFEMRTKSTGEFY